MCMYAWYIHIYTHINTYINKGIYICYFWFYIEIFFLDYVDKPLFVSSYWKGDMKKMNQRKEFNNINKVSRKQEEVEERGEVCSSYQKTEKQSRCVFRYGWEGVVVSDNGQHGQRRGLGAGMTKAKLTSVKHWVIIWDCRLATAY